MTAAGISSPSAGTIRCVKCSVTLSQFLLTLQEDHGIACLTVQMRTLRLWRSKTLAHVTRPGFTVLTPGYLYCTL